MGAQIPGAGSSRHQLPFVVPQRIGAAWCSTPCSSMSVIISRRRSANPGITRSSAKISCSQQRVGVVAVHGRQLGQQLFLRVVDVDLATLRGRARAGNGSTRPAQASAACADGPARSPHVSDGSRNDAIFSDPRRASRDNWSLIWGLLSRSSSVDAVFGGVHPGHRRQQWLNLVAHQLLDVSRR